MSGHSTEWLVVHQRDTCTHPVRPQGQVAEEEERLGLHWHWGAERESKGPNQNYPETRTLLVTAVASIRLRIMATSKIRKASLIQTLKGSGSVSKNKKTAFIFCTRKNSRCRNRYNDWLLAFMDFVALMVLCAWLGNNFTILPYIYSCIL
jgi:hypothetical protein